MRLRTRQYLIRANEYVRQVCKTYDLARAAKGVLEWTRGAVWVGCEFPSAGPNADNHANCDKNDGRICGVE